MVQKFSIEAILLGGNNGGEHHDGKGETFLLLLAKLGFKKMKRKFPI
jgi:hypothetical protein